MPAEPTDWKQITPERLVPAVQHIRKSFNTSDWKCSQLTKKLCYAALHSSSTDAASLAPYNKEFPIYRRIIGRRAEQQFDEFIKAGTPPSVFRAYLDAYYKGLGVEVRNQFDAVLEIALANAGILGQHPVEWTNSQLKLMIHDDAYRVKMWMRAVCDEQDYSTVETLDDFEDSPFWRSWRAPKLIHMRPAGNTIYDPATAWVREDEQRTQELLRNRSHRFVQFLEIDLENIAGEAYVRMAQFKRGDQVEQSQATAAEGPGAPDLAEAEMPKAPNSQKAAPVPDAGSGQSARTNRVTTSGALLSNYRSGLKRAILIQLTQNPNATDLEICRGVDADGSVELPASWKANRGDRSFVRAYSDRASRHKIEIAISKVRADLREAGLLSLFLGLMSTDLVGSSR
jgi:hypothetical protein